MASPEPAIERIYAPDLLAEVDALIFALCYRRLQQDEENGADPAVDAARANEGEQVDAVIIDERPAQS